MTRSRLSALLAAACFAVAGCGGDDDEDQVAGGEGKGGASKEARPSPDRDAGAKGSEEEEDGGAVAGEEEAERRARAEEQGEAPGQEQAARKEGRRRSGARRPPKRVTVVIKAFEYRPATVVVRRGGSVYWINKERRVNHTVTKKKGPSYAPDSPDVGWGGDTYEDFFRARGTIIYSCTYHPRMRGKVTVK
jgi:plastocyanin